MTRSKYAHILEADVPPLTPDRFWKSGNAWITMVDMRTHTASKLNQKCYRNLTIAIANGKIPNDTEVRTNGHQVSIKVKTLAAAHAVSQWLDTFEENWAESKL